MNNVYKSALVATFALSLTACGGSSNSDNSTPQPLPLTPANSAPTVSVNDTTANENASVTISAIATDADGDELTFSWTQVSGDAIAYTDNGSSISLVAPEVNLNSEFIFEVSVSDGTSSTVKSVTLHVSNVLTQTEIKTLLKQQYQELRRILDSEREETWQEGYESVGWYNTYNIDAHGDGDIDVLVTAVAHLDHENDREIYGQSYLIVNEDNESYSLKPVGIGKSGRTLEILDLNNDGLDDVYFANHGYESPSEGVFPGGQDYVWLQGEGATFIDVSDQLIQKLDFTHGSCSEDYRQSGINDIITTYGNDVIYKLNEGTGSFSESSNRLPLLAISDNYAREHHELEEDAPISISHYWCESMDVNGDGAPDVVLGGRGSPYPAVNGSGQDVNFHNTLMINNGNGEFKLDDVSYVSFVNNGLDSDEHFFRELHPTGIFELDLDGDKCSDFAVYHTSYGGHESYNVYKNSCDTGVSLSYTWQAQGETYCEHIVGDSAKANSIIAWCGSEKAKKLIFGGAELSISELTIDEIVALPSADFLKVTEHHEFN